MKLNQKQAPALGMSNVQGGANQPPQFDVVEASKPAAIVNNGADVNAGLAAMFGRNPKQVGQSTASTPNKMEAGNVQGQQGLAGALGNYRSMGQPNGGNNYQVVGGVQNIV